jgi:bifunctional non-homologous end joining protein LigD
MAARRGQQPPGRASVWAQARTATEAGAGDALSLVRGRLPRSIEPMLARPGGQPFDSPSHIFEVLWDGVRALAFIEGDRVRLQDRHLQDVTDRFPELREMGRQVESEAAVLDGAIVALDDEGQPDFQLLRERLVAEGNIGTLVESAPVTFQAFDALYWKARPVMEYPLWRRKNLLLQAMRPGPLLMVPEHIEREGVAFFDAVRQHGLPGIVAKQRNAAYTPGQRSSSWLKVRVFQKEEFVIGGFTYGGRATGGRRRKQAPFATLLLGSYDDSGGLVYVGEVGGGFTREEADRTVRTLDALVAPHCPFREAPPARRLVFWCRPELAASVRFSEWTAERTLRFPVFEGLRPDVPPRGCRLDAAYPA